MDRAQQGRVLRSAWEVVEVMGGLVLLAAPGTALRLLRVTDSGPIVAAARLLGARWMAQSVTTALRPGPGAPVASAVVSGLHAVSMLPLLASRSYRRAAAVSAALAVADVGANWAIAARSDRDAR